jgi:hypothetical protein
MTFQEKIWIWLFCLIHILGITFSIGLVSYVFDGFPNLGFTKLDEDGELETNNTLTLL